MVEVGRQLETPVKVSGMAVRTGQIRFCMTFSVEIINGPRFGKMKMRTMELYDGATDPEKHLGVHKAPVYVQVVDDIACYQYFLVTLKVVAQSWFNGLTLGSAFCFQDLADRFVIQYIASRKERRSSIHLLKIKQRS